MNFTDRLKLEKRYYRWYKKNKAKGSKDGASDCPFNVVTFLDSLGMLAFDVEGCDRRKGRFFRQKKDPEHYVMSERRPPTQGKRRIRTDAESLALDPELIYEPSQTREDC